LSSILFCGAIACEMIIGLLHPYEIKRR